MLWPAPLTATGDLTLLGHGHDDGFGAVGFCAAVPSSGQTTFRLIAAGFETDDGDAGLDSLPPYFWRQPELHDDGVGFSGGRVNVYINVLDENGDVLQGVSAPDVRVVATPLGGETVRIPLDNKPAHEFQTNFNMVGGRMRYSVRLDTAEGTAASDEVWNLRLPVNHHVTYELIFQRVVAP